MRWIGIALAVGLAAIALMTLVRSERGARAPARAQHESIDDTSRAELEAVLRKSGAGESSP
jgi:hypothetical protein